LWDSGSLKTDLLWEKYKLIDNLFKKSNSNRGSFGTFFCTGIIAEKEPNLIKKIANDGHEIGCHYYFHDFMKNESLYNVEKNLIKAKTLLEEASGKKVIGFRAPYFAIEKRNPLQYKIVEKLFEYDSSFSCTSKKELESFKNNMGLKTLKLLPIFQKKFGIINLKLGGSFLKFPKIYMNWMINQSVKEGFTPHLYMHPYEFGNSENFSLTMKDLENLGLKKSIYWKFRQMQWLKIRNNILHKQIKNLINKNHLDGILANSI